MFLSYFLFFLLHFCRLTPQETMRKNCRRLNEMGAIIHNITPNASSGYCMLTLCLYTACHGMLFLPPSFFTWQCVCIHNPALSSFEWDVRKWEKNTFTDRRSTMNNMLRMRSRMKILTSFLSSLFLMMISQWWTFWLISPPPYLALFPNLIDLSGIPNLTHGFSWWGWWWRNAKYTNTPSIGSYGAIVPRLFLITFALEDRNSHLDYFRRLFLLTSFLVSFFLSFILSSIWTANTIPRLQKIIIYELFF